MTPSAPVGSTLVALLPLLLPAPYQEGERLGAEELVAEAWRFLPQYDGAHREFLAPETRRETLAGAHLLDGALALEPDHMRALWSLGHARILLAEDARNRGEREAAVADYERAVAALDRGIELAPSDPWALYARGAAHAAFGAFDTALEDLARAVEAADAEIAAGTAGDSVPWLRFKALEWRTEVLMRQGDHPGAADALRAFHEEFSNNAWPMHIALAENALRARHFDAASESYLDAIELFPTDHQAYALLAYLAGLRRDRESATTRLREALERELQPGIYTRLWLLILATDEARPAAREDFASFVQYPPSEIPQWDLTLARFVLGDGTPDAFLEAAHAESKRRMDAGEVLDDLPCEAHYYAGLRHELDAAALDGAERTARLEAALDAYRTSLRLRPLKWKWEWAYARLHFTNVAAELGHAARGAILLTDDSPLDLENGAALVSSSWHRSGDGKTHPALDGDPRPGDLYLSRMRKDGRVVPARMVVDAHPR